MKIIARYFKAIFFALFLVYSFFKMLPRDFDALIASWVYGLITITLSISIVAVFLQEKSAKSITLKSLSIIFVGIEIIAGIIAFIFYKGFLFNDIPTWLKLSLGTPPAVVVFLAILTLDKVREIKGVSPESDTDTYSALSTKLRSKLERNLPTYEISSLLSISGSEDKIVMLEYTESYSG
jgi:hypothetical protein